MIPLFKPSISEKGLREVRSVLKSGIWAVSWGGPKVKELEEKFAQYIGCRSAVAVNSGTATLYLALQTVPRGEVLLPSLTFVATAHAVVAAGSRPVFVDVEEDTLNISIEDLKNKITPKTKGIVPVHFAGRPCRIHEILKIASENNLWVVDDCSHAHGSTYDGKKIGSFFDRSCFSLHPIKPVCSLGGGIITFNTRSLKQRLETLRFCGVNPKTRMGPKYDVDSIGWNYYMTEPSAAVALDSLSRVDAEAEKRRKIAKFYCENLRDIKGIETLPYDPECTYHLYVLKVGHRDGFMKYMWKHGIETGIHYRGVHTFTYYRDPNIKLSITERVMDEIVSLPCYPSLTDINVHHIVDSVKLFRSY